MTARLALAALLLTCSHLATTRAQALDPIYVGPEIWLPNTAQAVAYDGNGNFLAAYACSSGICGARVEAASGLVEAHELVTTVGYPDNLRLAFDGQRFLLVWEETRERRDIYAARVMPNGACLDPGGFVVSRDLVPNMEGTERLDRDAPEVAFDGSTFVVYWLELVLPDGSIAIYSARVASSGELLDPAGVTSGTVYQGSLIEIAVDGTVLAITGGANRYFMTFITAMGWGLWATGASFGLPGVSVGDGSVLVVFQVDDPYWLMSAGGAYAQVLGAPGGLIQFSPLGAMPLAAWEGTNHLVVWTEGGNTVGLRLPSSGVFAETRQVCVNESLCTTSPMPEFEAPGAATALASNGRGVSFVTMEDESARLLTSNLELAASDGLLAADAAVTAVPAPDLKNVNMRDALRNQLKSVGNMVKGKDYALAEITLDDIATKMDGCALCFAPHPDDWIRSCASQRKPHAIVTTLKRHVSRLTKKPHL